MCIRLIACDDGDHTIRLKAGQSTVLRDYGCHALYSLLFNFSTSAPAIADHVFGLSVLTVSTILVNLRNALRELLHIGTKCLA